ncbi:MAG TPA: hypothetical protein VK196_18715 [Magnetospirillum sp.]|nr:hypothetical protein [Magnetospirillum sp.]
MRAAPIVALLAMSLAAAPSLAQTVACDAKVTRIVRNLRSEPMTADQADRAREALYAAIEKCRPLHSGSSGARRDRLSQGEPPPDTTLERQSWRAQQNALGPAERREGERRLDAIDRKAQTDPRAARDMQRIWEADRSLNTINRPIPGGPANPSLVGPGDRN